MSSERAQISTRFLLFLNVYSKQARFDKDIIIFFLGPLMIYRVGFSKIVCTHSIIPYVFSVYSRY